jgi:hypothetical protein
MGLLTGLLLPIIPGLINLAETAFTKPKEGVNKMDMVLQGLRAIATKLITSMVGVPKPENPSDDTLKAITETILAQMKAAGTLGASGTGQFYLLNGTVTPLVPKVG